MDNKELDTLSDNLFSLMMDFHRQIFRPEELIKSLPIPPSHAKVIFYLSHNGCSSVSTMAKDLCISKPNMTPIIDRLIDEGYVTRYEDPNDRRVIIVEVTNKAEECFKMKKKIAKQLLSNRLAKLSDSDKLKLEQITSDFRCIFEKIE